jgi:integrase
LKDAVRWGVLARNPIEAADPPRISSAREMKTWTAEQLEAFLTFTAEDRLHALWQLLALTGMRRSEACGLRWCDCDLEQGRIAVRRTLVPIAHTVLVSEPKTARGKRSIALDERTVAVLKAHAARQLAERECAKEWIETGLVFTRTDGQALPPNSVSRWFVRSVKQAKLPEIRLHDLRHSHATLALQAGIHPGHLLARDPSAAGRGRHAHCGAGFLRANRAAMSARCRHPYPSRGGACTGKRKRSGPR